jgi:predicted nuclease with TOPRIM domain
VPWWTWIALGAFALTVVAAAIFAVFAFGRLKRLSATGQEIAGRLEKISRSGEELERRLEHVDERTELVQRRLERLEGSLERLGVLSWALGDARDGITRLRQAYLRK